MKLINICHLLCFNCKKQGKMLSLRVFTALANLKEVVLLIPVYSPLCVYVQTVTTFFVLNIEKDTNAFNNFLVV